jgi:hypothetical protein
MIILQIFIKIQQCNKSLWRFMYSVFICIKSPIGVHVQCSEFKVNLSYNDYEKFNKHECDMQDKCVSALRHFTVATYYDEILVWLEFIAQRTIKVPHLGCISKPHCQQQFILVVGCFWFICISNWHPQHNCFQLLSVITENVRSVIWMFEFNTN